MRRIGLSCSCFFCFLLLKLFIQLIPLQQNVNLVDSFGRSSLHEAAREGHVGIVRLLITHVRLLELSLLTLKDIEGR
jgi:ankyrin repeat protein